MPTSRRYYARVEAAGEGSVISHQRGPAEVSRGKESLLLAPRRRRPRTVRPELVTVCSVAGLGRFPDDRCVWRKNLPAREWYEDSFRCGGRVRGEAGIEVGCRERGDDGRGDHYPSCPARRPRRDNNPSPLVAAVVVTVIIVVVLSLSLLLLPAASVVWWWQ